MTRFQKLLAGLLLVQIVLLLIVYLPRAADTAAGGPLFPDLTADAVTEIALENQNGPRTVLVKAGDGWVVAESDGYPADASRIGPLLEKIAGLQANRSVAATAAAHARLQVSDAAFARRVTLTTADDARYLLYLGSSPNPGATHVRNGADNATYLTNGLTQFDVDATVANWIDAAYAALNREEVTALTLQNGNGTFRFVKAADGAWGLDEALGAGETFDPTTFNTILARIINLRLTRPLGVNTRPEYGLDAPGATVSVVVQRPASAAGAAPPPPETFTLQIGAQADDNNQYVKWSGSRYYATVARFNITPILDAARDQFVQPAAAPEGEGGG